MTVEPTPLDLTQFKSWKIDIVNRVDPYCLDRHDMQVSFDATFSVDSATYARLAKQEAVYTVQWSEDRNPWHRKASGRRARLRRLRDGAWWTFQRRVLRRDLLETVKITVPQCRIVPAPPD